MKSSEMPNCTKHSGVCTRDSLEHVWLRLDTQVWVWDQHLHWTRRNLGTQFAHRRNMMLLRSCVWIQYARVKKNCASALLSSAPEDKFVLFHSEVWSSHTSLESEWCTVWTYSERWVVGGGICFLNANSTEGDSHCIYVLFCKVTQFEIIIVLIDYTPPGFLSRCERICSLSQRWKL